MRNLFLSIFFIIFLAAFGFCQEPQAKPVEKKKTELKYNPYTGEFEEALREEGFKYVPKKPEQKEDPVTKKKKITIPAATQERYNPLTGGFEEAKPTEGLQYDPVSGSWSYETEQAGQRYNPYTGQMEKADPSETLQYNPQSGTWSYE
ncbi:hypothetical protein EPO66_03915 [bacterium]|nr:MAG: hypothetical protein EPO66_03915 [bacterium]